jgi:hypothetical protein
VIGGECPSFLLRQVHALQLTLAPNAMDGDIETVGCTGIVMHCVPSVGFIAQSPNELCRFRLLPSFFCPRCGDLERLKIQGPRDRVWVLRVEGSTLAFFESSPEFILKFLLKRARI